MSTVCREFIRSGAGEALLRNHEIETWNCSALLCSVLQSRRLTVSDAEVVGCVTDEAEKPEWRGLIADRREGKERKKSRRKGCSYLLVRRRDFYVGWQ